LPSAAIFDWQQSFVQSPNELATDHPGYLSAICSRIVVTPTQSIRNLSRYRINESQRDGTLLNRSTPLRDG
jgi:hypothetical protein